MESWSGRLNYQQVQRAKLPAVYSSRYTWFAPFLLCNRSHCPLFVPHYENNTTQKWEQELLSFTFPHSLCVDKGKHYFWLLKDCCCILPPFSWHSLGFNWKVQGVEVETVTKKLTTSKEMHCPCAEEPAEKS